MKPAAHVRFLAIAAAAWALFWVIGLPSYYQQYSRTTMIVVCAVLIPPVFAIAYAVLKRVAPERRMTVAAWLSFYFTIPLALYDYLYCGVYLGYGVNFLIVFWYLTVFYIVPWIVLPAIAVVLNARHEFA